VAALGALGLALLGGCSKGLPEFDGKLYELSRRVELPVGERGRLIESQRTGGAPDGMRSYRFLYQSQGAKDEPISVTGLVYRPDEKAPADGFPVIVYAHGTTGVADACAPSRTPSSVSLIKDLVQAGYAVVQTDYQGLGTPGPHPYLHGPSEGRTVLDSLVAARQLDAASLNQERAAIWGFSQGGHAALAASQMTEDVQRLGIVGVVDAAGPSRGAWLTDAVDIPGGSRYQFTVLAQASWSEVFGLDLAAVAGPALVERAPQLLDESTEHCPDAEQIAAQVPVDQRVTQRMSDVPGWRDALAAADIPTAPAAAPVFIQHGTSDDVVPFGESIHSKQLLCVSGTPVAVNVQQKGTHITAVDPGPPLQWLADRFAGRPPPNDC
jgi:acetyl esterase/lipase